MNALTLVGACIFAMAQPVVAHADALDERVAAAAREALRTGDFSPVAIWVEPARESTLQAAFRHALEVRALGGKGRDVADRYFVEAAARLHRDGARPLACTPAATVEPAIAVDDEDALVAAVVTHVRAQLHERFREVANHRARRRGDIIAGRAYVARYRELVRYVTAVYAAASVAIAPRDDERDHYEY